MNIPKEPYMLLSFINTKLRDDFDSLDSFCESYNVDKQEIEEKLFNIGYKYIANENQFKA
ncbi:DUF4250 domain-containing protein [[Clostridium] colinum]|uniref:DUF4250 domain-containing protein n=1 Tax=[Clostridium] colinum TaxID=36835 RepID=UPI002023DC4E|nr:DUF4250 domain-containing protein [[Clostridium] colinum]